MKRPLQIEVSNLAGAQIHAAQDWWRVNRLKSPNATREELERASLLISVQPEIGARARNISLAGVRRLHLARGCRLVRCCAAAEAQSCADAAEHRHDECAW